MPTEPSSTDDPNAFPTNPEYLDEAAAAAFLGIPPIRLLKWRKAHRVPHSKPTAKTVVYLKSDLVALLRATRVEATTPPPAPRSNPKSAAHRAAIASGQSAAWERRRVEHKS